MVLFRFNESDTHTSITIFGIRIKFHVKHAYFFSRLYFRIVRKYCKTSENKFVVVNMMNWQYACNLKYIVDELLKRPESKNIDFVWLTSGKTQQALIPKNFRCVPYDSFRALYELFTAKVWLANAHMLLPFKKGMVKSPQTIFFQTYHGSMGIKKIEADTGKTFRALGWYKWQEKACECMNYLFTDSDMEKNLFHTAFWQYGETLKLGKARDSIFYKDPTEIIHKVKDYYHIPYDHKIFLYAPTWRTNKKMSYYNVDIKLLKKSLTTRFGGEWEILIRSHIHMNEKILHALYDESMVIDVTKYVDMQELLVAADVLMTDYSSCLPEFTILKKPSFIYATDIDMYANGFYYPLDILPSPIATDNYELAEKILNFDEKIFRKKAEEFLQKMGHQDDEFSCVRIVDFMLEKMKDKNSISMEAPMKLHSFDIFDTLITRRVADPAGIFVLMQNTLMRDPAFFDMPDELKENFFRHRTNAEYRQRRMHVLWKNGVDITLKQIYKDIKETLYLTDEEAERLENLEIRTELENILPIKENIELVKQLMSEKKRVVLISDMYLHEDTIRQMLVKCDPALSDIPIYVSSSVGFMKNKSALYQFVQDEERVAYKDWTHIGDNKNSDFTIAKKLGIKAKLYNYVSNTAYEKEILKTYKFNTPYVQLSIGCSKYIRLENSSKSPLFHLGASLGGPILYPYISWVIAQAIKRKLKRLYFIARDSYILKQIADIIIEDKGLDIQTFYVYGSRKAWRLSSLTLEAKELYAQFIETAMWTYQILDEVFGMSKEELLPLLPKKFHGFAQGLGAKERQELKKFLLNDSAVFTAIIKHAGSVRSAALGYLKQAIDTSDDAFAFVELDGSGFTQNCLAELVSDFYPSSIKSFFLASTAGIFIPLKVDRYCFYALKKAKAGSYLELLTKAPHGQTLGYTLNGNLWEPVLEQKNSSFSLDEYMEGVLAYARAFITYEHDNPHISFQNLIVLNQYETFIVERVDAGTADILGQIPHAFYGDENLPFAPKITLKDALKFLFTHHIKTEDLRYSSLRSRKLPRKIIEFRTKYLVNFKKLLHMK